MPKSLKRKPTETKDSNSKKKQKVDSSNKGDVKAKHLDSGRRGNGRGRPRGRSRGRDVYRKRCWHGPRG